MNRQEAQRSAQQSAWNRFAAEVSQLHGGQWDRARGEEVWQVQVYPRGAEATEWDIYTLGVEEPILQPRVMMPDWVSVLAYDGSAHYINLTATESVRVIMCKNWEGSATQDATDNSGAVATGPTAEVGLRD